MNPSSRRPRVALVDPHALRRARLEALVARLPATAIGFAGVPRDAAAHDLVLLVDDAGAPPIDAARAAFPTARVIVCGQTSSQHEAIAAFRAGADDFVWLGAGDAEIAQVLASHLPAEGGATPAPDDGGLVGVSERIVRLRDFVRKIAPTSATVLITGESGSGKDVAATLIHRLSPRAQRPLVALNCAAIPDALVEGELFGYERGAFSGAHTAYPGKLKLADGGTLLLDELGELSLPSQAKLLRAIETRESWRLGARAPTHFDARIIAITNRDLAIEVREGRFREDLFYRLAVSQVHLPALRERPEDIAPIARCLLQRLAQDAGRVPPRLEETTLRRLMAHSWPGNVRELRNALEMASINAGGERIRPCDLPALLQRSRPIAATASPPSAEDERAQLLAALDAARGNKSLAAQRLNCSRMTLYRRLQRHGLVPPVPA